MPWYTLDITSLLDLKPGTLIGPGFFLRGALASTRPFLRRRSRS